MIHWSVLDSDRQAAAAKLELARERDFYLAGGTALALQIGHRDSIDFDFFRHDPFDTEELFRHLARSFRDQRVVKVQDEQDTLTVTVDERIKVSFMAYPYPMLEPCVDAGPFGMASVADIGCMKLSAITGRAAMKDYVDLFFILQRMSLTELLQLCGRKLPRLDRALILKSLVFFDDVLPEPIMYIGQHRVEFAGVKEFLRDQVRTVY